MSAHRSKLKLRRLRYHENCVKHVSLLLEAITLDPTIRFSKPQPI